MSRKSPALTSTPFTCFTPSQHPSEDLDSGYHSNLSEQSKSCSSRTSVSREHVFGDLSTTSAEQKNVKNIVRFKYFRPNFIHLEFVDFLYHLGEKSDHSLVVKKIFDLVTNEDLYNASLVSKTWKKVLLSIPSLRKRYRLITKEVELTKENRMVVNHEYCSPCEERRAPNNQRSMLTEIQNTPSIRRLNASASPSSPSSPLWNPNYRFEAFQMEAQRVKIGKRLYPCPKCRLPSHVDEAELQTAVCTNRLCEYRFCILCQCEAHPSRVCTFISTPMVRKQVSLVGSRGSKRNLKRLLL